MRIVSKGWTFREELAHEPPAEADDGESPPPEDGKLFFVKLTIRPGETFTLTNVDGSLKVERQIDGEATHIAGELPAPEDKADE